MSTCERCNDTGFEDSGGVQPWGEQILVECECRLMERNMDESRKQFERFLREEHLYSDDELFWEEDRNCYSIYPVHIAWKAWQASREVVSVELPEPYDDGRGNLWLPQDNTTAAIRSAGIKVKE